MLVKSDGSMEPVPEDGIEVPPGYIVTARGEVVRAPSQASLVESEMFSSEEAMDRNENRKGVPPRKPIRNRSTGFGRK
jgi:hypothetical protein